MTIPDIRPRSGRPYDQRLARFLIKPFAKTGLYPNAVTGLSFALGLTAAYMFAVAIEAMAGLAALLMEAAPEKTVSAVEVAIFRSCVRPKSMNAERANRGVPDGLRALEILRSP